MPLNTDTQHRPCRTTSTRSLIDAHAGLTEAQSATLNARLILLLANQVGDLDTLRAAIAVARAAREGLDR